MRNAESVTCEGALLNEDDLPCAGVLKSFKQLRYANMTKREVTEGKDNTFEKRHRRAIATVGQNSKWLPPIHTPI